MSKVLRCDVVVVGAGVIGSCAALNLARAGQDTILLDQFPVPHERGSSHGHTRKIRQANFGNPALTPIMGDALIQWRRIQAQACQNLLRPSPILVLVNKRQQSLMDSIANSIKDQGHSFQWLEPSAITAKYKMNVTSTTLAAFDSSGGVLMADKCVAAVQQLYVGAGGRLVDEWQVDDIKVGPDDVAEVKGPRGTVKANSIVLCPGPWAGKMLDKLGLQIPLRVLRVPVMYWPIKDKSTSTTTFLDFSSEPGRMFGGFLEMEYPGMVKIQYHGGVDGDAMNPGQGDTQSVVEMTKTYVKKHFPGLIPEPYMPEHCFYTNTPDEDFVLDRHPNHPNIVFACGFSGTGFKLAPVVGEELCRLVLGLPPRHDMHTFSANRFSFKPTSPST